MQAQLTQGDGAQEALPHFRSADSVPVQYAMSRPVWLVPLFLALFALASAVVIEFTGQISFFYKALLAEVNGLQSAGSLGHGTLGFRPFFGLLIIFIGMFSAGPLHGRLRFTLPIFSFYVLGVFAADSTFLQLRSFGTPPPFSTVGNLVAGFVGVSMVALGVFSLYNLPADSVVHRRVRRSLIRYYLALLLSIVIAIVATQYALGPGLEYVNKLRQFGLLGGLGPGFALFLPCVLLSLFLIGWLDVWLLRAVRNRQRRKALRNGPIDPSQLPEVAFLVAAFNEEAQIRECILTLDRAAARYDGVVRLYLVDNNSKDATKAIASSAVDECVALSHQAVRILDCLTPGKSHALNYGLLRTTEEIIVRVDADTIVEASLLEHVMPYFDDQTVGGVTGMPLPKKRFSIFGLMRTIEIYYSVGFNRVAQSAIDAVMVLPGIMTAYRREPLVELGGFAEGINGEDTDMSVRIGRLGYKLLVDPRIHFYTEVPSSLAHMREQRLRWSRSLYHVAARNMSAIKMRQGTRGWWVMAWAVYYSGRRLIVMPILVYGLLLLLVDPSNPALRQGASLGALMLGPQVFALTVTLLLYRQFALVPLIPAFMLFRVLRGYFAFESFFTLPAIATVPVAERREEPSVAAAGVAIPTPAGGTVGGSNGWHPVPARPVLAGSAVNFAVAATPVMDLRDDPLHFRSNGAARRNHLGVDHPLSASHPIRRVKLLTDQALERLSGTFSTMNGKGGGNGHITPSTLIKASILMSTHNIRDERSFCRELSHNRVFAWFMDMDPEYPVLDADELISSGRHFFRHDVARQFVEAVTKDARRRGLYPGSPLLVNNAATLAR